MCGRGAPSPRARGIYPSRASSLTKSLTFFLFLPLLGQKWEGSSRGRVCGILHPSIVSRVDARHRSSSASGEAAVWAAPMTPTIPTTPTRPSVPSVRPLRILLSLFPLLSSYCAGRARAPADILQLCPEAHARLRVPGCADSEGGARGPRLGHSSARRA
jgi:hypothetical protein